MPELQRATWATVSTVKESWEVLRRFVAHHKSIGADEIHLYFDDPHDECASRLRDIQGVHVVLCDGEHWNGDRPEAHQARQTSNANRFYRRAATDWVIHLDADELVHSAVEPGRVLARRPTEEKALRLLPAESLEGGREGVHFFKRALGKTRRDTRIGLAAYGDHYPVLVGGLLSHSAGKYFVRSRLPETRLRIHGPIIGGARASAEISRDMELLHFHGDGEDAWIASVQRRLDFGAYREGSRDSRKKTGSIDGLGLNGYLRRIISSEGEDGLRRFYRDVAVMDDTKRKLRRSGALAKRRMWFDAKESTWFPAAMPGSVRELNSTASHGRLAGTTFFRGLELRVALEGNFTETSIALGHDPERDEMDAITRLVEDRRVNFWDVGANVGIYSLVVARAAADDSEIHAFEPNPELADRFETNIALNKLDRISVHREALGRVHDEATLHLHENAGQSSLISDKLAEAITVPLRRLSDYLRKAPRRDLSILKIDIEGAEPMVLEEIFSNAPADLWPDVILYEHAHASRWSTPPNAVFPPRAYEALGGFKNNTLLRKIS